MRWRKINLLLQMFPCDMNVFSVLSAALKEATETNVQSLKKGAFFSVFTLL